jgi:hypothetical protein
MKLTNNNNGSASSGSGIGVLGLMGVMFIGLKLTGYINWPWVWVLAPFWGAFLLAIVFLAIAAILIAVIDK